MNDIEQLTAADADEAVEETNDKAEATVETKVEDKAEETVETPSADDSQEAEASAETSTEASNTETKDSESASDVDEPDAAAAKDDEQAGEAADADEDDEIVDSPYDRPGRWYVIHTQSGYENKVRNNLLARTQSMNMEELIYEVVIPLEDVVEFKNGKKVVVQKKVFPGYLLTRMRLDDDSWFVVRNTPGVTGFIGAGNKPSPLPRRDVESFLAVKEDGAEPVRKGRPRLEFAIDETVRVKQGPFADFQGRIDEINEDQLKLKVLVNIFGRETPVELQFTEVAKI